MVKAGVVASAGDRHSYIVVGGGAAGFNAVKAIREKDASSSVLLVSTEKVLPYNRPMLTKVLSQPLTEEKLLIKPEEWYAEHGIVVLLNAEVQSVDANRKSILLSDGTQMIGDRLILCQGARCFVPPIPGSELKHVVAIRSIDDVRKVKALCETARNAVIIGGGVLGIEAAWGLLQCGLHVAVVETMGRMMQRQLDDAASAFLSGIIKARGCDMFFNAVAEKITEDAVCLQDGTRLPADLVIISAGIRANTKIVEGSGLPVERAMVVNARMETGFDGVYAAGDCVQLNGRQYGLWPAATQMGAVAGMNAAGEEAVFAVKSTPMTMMAFGTSLFVVGDNGYNESLTYEMVNQVNTENALERLTFCHGKLVGVTTIGSNKKNAAYQKAVLQGVSKEEALAF